MSSGWHSHRPILTTDMANIPSKQPPIHPSLHPSLHHVIAVIRQAYSKSKQERLRIMQEYLSLMLIYSHSTAKSMQTPKLSTSHECNSTPCSLSASTLLVSGFTDVELGCRDFLPSSHKSIGPSPKTERGTMDTSHPWQSGSRRRCQCLLGL